MNKLIKQTQGVITIFISLMLTAILSIGSLVLEAGRFQSARTQLAEANISAATSTLSEYNSDLFERFGIVAFEGDNYAESLYSDYLTFNSDLSGESFGSNVSRLYSLDNHTLTGLYNLTYPSVLKRQIIAKSKYLKGSFNLWLTAETMPRIFTEFKSKAQSVAQWTRNISGEVSSDISSAAASIESSLKNSYDYDDSLKVVIDSGTMSLLPTATGTIENSIPDGEKENIQATLEDAKKVVGNYSSSIGNIDSSEAEQESTVGLNALLLRSNSRLRISQKDISSLSAKCSSTSLNISNILSRLSQGEEGQNNLLLNLYIAQYFSNRTQTAAGYIGPPRYTSSAEGFTSACAEYVFCGNKYETENQKNAYWVIFYLRLVDNAYKIFSTYESRSSADKLLWSYYETLIDMEMLTSEESLVPLTKEALFLPMEKAGAVASSFSSTRTVPDSLRSVGSLTEYKRSDYSDSSLTVNGKDFFNYTDYISFALWLVPNSNKLLRVADLIQTEMRYRQKYVNRETASFLMQNQYTYARVEANAKFNSILPIISLGSNSNLNGIGISSINYVGY